jgi:RimJ/RimL family protein N-acetyltransferase
MTLLESPPPDTLRESCTPVLETERLILRAPRFEDAKTMATLINDRRVAENLASAPYPYTLADAEAFIRLAQKPGRKETFLITLPGDIIVGGCGVGMLGDPEPEPGYWIAIPYWGRGYATEAARALVDHAFGPLGFDRLHARARVTNPASRRVLENCGFAWTGVGLTRVRALRASVPVDRFQLDRSTWASRLAAPAGQDRLRPGDVSRVVAGV